MVTKQQDPILGEGIKSENFVRHIKGDATGTGTADINSSECHLESYYADSQLKPAVFLKALRSAKLRSFRPDDLAAASKILFETDQTLRRTAAFLGKGPDPIRRWVTHATRISIRHLIPNISIDEVVAPVSLFQQVLQACQSDLYGKDRQFRDRAQNLLRLTLAWLLEKKNLNPIDALRLVWNLERERIGRPNSDPSVNVARLLSRANIRQLKDCSLIAALSDATTSRIESERQVLVQDNVKLHANLIHRDEQLREAVERLDAVQSKVAALAENIAVLRKELGEEKDLRALDHSRAVAHTRRFLTERIGQFLSDARDALEFSPPHVDAVAQRIELVIEEIAKELERINE